MSIYIFYIGHLGDTLVGIPAIAKIKEVHPNESLVLITNKPAKDYFVTSWDVLKYTNLIDHVIFYNKSDLKDILRLAYNIRTYGKKKILYYLISNSRSLGQSLRDYIFFKVMCGFNKILGINESIYKKIIKDKDGNLIKVEKESERLLKIIYKIHGLDYKKEYLPKAPLLSPSTEHYKKVKVLLKKMSSEAILIIVGHGAKTSAQMWQIERFRRLCELLINYNDKICIILVGTKEDYANGEYLRNGFENKIINLSGKTNIIESAAVISKCVLYIGNDSGTMHLAASMGIPCIGIFSARNNSGRWDPYGESNVILRKKVKCEGCSLAECTENNRCLELISIEEVFESTINFLKNDRRNCF